MSDDEDKNDNDNIEPALDELITIIQINFDENVASSDTSHLAGSAPAHSALGISDNLFLRLATPDDDQ